MSAGKPEHRGRVTLNTTGLERRAKSLAGEVVELRRLVEDLGSRNRRLQVENDQLRAKEAAVARHWQGFLSSLGVSSVEELKALLDRATTTRPGDEYDLDRLIARERDRRR